MYTHIYLYHSEYKVCSFHIHFYIQNVSVDATYGILRVFLVELESLYGTMNQTLYIYICSHIYIFMLIYLPMYVDI